MLRCKRVLGIKENISLSFDPLYKLNRLFHNEIDNN